MTASAPSTDKKPRPEVKRSPDQDYAFYRAGGHVDHFRAHHIWQIGQVAQLRANLFKAKAAARRQQEKVEQRIREGYQRQLIDWAFEDFGGAYATLERYRLEKYSLCEKLKAHRNGMLPLP